MVTKVGKRMVKKEKIKRAGESFQPNGYFNP